MGRQRGTPRERGNSTDGHRGLRASRWSLQGQTPHLCAPAPHFIAGTSQEFTRTETAPCSSRCPHARSEFGAGLSLYNTLPQLVFRQGLKIHCVQGQKGNGSKQSQTSVRFLRMVGTGAKPECRHVGMWAQPCWVSQILREVQKFLNL